MYNKIKNRRGENKNKGTFICDSCGKTFATNFCLLRHKSTVHELRSNQFICNECDKIFQRKDNLLRHILSHGVRQISADELNCETCHRSFNSKSKLRTHNHQQHGIVPDEYSTEQYICYNCSAEFSGKSNLIRHFRTCRPHKECPGSKIKCLNCSSNFRDKRSLTKHYKEVHNIEFKFEYKFFATSDEFEKWLPQSFHREANWKTSVDNVTILRCHRSGIYVDNCKKNNTERKRRLKASGTKKLQGFCPAEINVRERLSDGSCSVTYQTVHVGHNVNDKKEQLYMPLPGPKSSKTKNEKRKLVLQILRADSGDTTGLDDTAIPNDSTCQNMHDPEPDEGQDDRSNIVNKIGTCYVSDCEAHLTKESFTIDVLVDDQTWQLGWYSTARGLVEVKMYLVRRVDVKECDSLAESCRFRCDYCKSCIHEFLCSCHDSAVSKRMCKHIHALSLFRLNEKTAEQNSVCAEMVELPDVSARRSNKLLFDFDAEVLGDGNDFESVKQMFRSAMEEVISLITPESDSKIVEAFYQNYIQPLPSMLKAMRMGELPSSGQEHQVH